MDAILAALADRVDDALPQTQCRQCGHAGCRPYAEAVAAGEAINRCPPGGDAGVAALAGITGRPVIPLDPARGAPGPLLLARIDEIVCIGCTLCIAACPVDAIVGGPKRMHTVLAALCTGCELCLPPCPVDCIAMIPAGRSWSTTDAGDARLRHAKREARLRAAPTPDSGSPPLPLPATPAVAQASGVGATATDTLLLQTSAEQRRAAIVAAQIRARARRAAIAPKP